MTKNFETEPLLHQDLASFYGKTYNLPPLAARIYAYLLFDFEKEGISFDELVEIFDASKSSVSSNLNLLIKEQLISDIHKPQLRKRFFIINEHYVKNRFQQIISRLQAELEIMNRLNTLRNGNENHHSEKFEIYRSLLSKNIKNIQDSLIKLYDEN